MNDFQVLSKLGEGAYSIVYKTIRNVDDKVYALKKVKLLNLSEKEKLNALNEVRILASIKSNFVVSYKEAFFDENESILGIVMEYADKGDLYQKISEFKKASIYFEESDIWRIFIQLVKGLKSLHDLKILHRDLKSANVFLFNDGSAKLGDLNVSKVARRGLGYTQTGTPYYASPEVWKDQPYDLKSDIWSLGCVLYEIISLRPPFRAENMEGLYNKVVKGQISKIPPNFSSDLADMVRLLIQVQPENRPTCDQILKNPNILKRTDVIQKFGDDIEINNLLQTIRIPKNLLILTERLPQANYGNSDSNKKNLSTELKNHNQFPEILARKPKNKKKDESDGNQERSDKQEKMLTQDENRSRKRKPKLLYVEGNSGRDEENNKPHGNLDIDEKLQKMKEDLKAKSPRHRNEEGGLPIVNRAKLHLPPISVDKKYDKHDFHSVDKHMSPDVILKNIDGDDKKKIIKILKNNNNNDEIYKIYGVNMKNKIDRSVNMRYDLYKPKKLLLENNQKIVVMPRKLSPLRKIKV